MKRSIEEYADIISLPHHQSETHPHMSRLDRAAQFAPFAALSGYGDAVKETARLTDGKPELSEADAAALDAALHRIQEHLADRPEVQITCFRPDEKKEGGACLSITGVVRKLDEMQRILILEDGTVIPLGDMIAIEECGTETERSGTE